MADTVTPIYGFTQPEVGGSTDTWGGKENTDLTLIEQEIARHRIPFLSPAVGATTTLNLDQAAGARVFAFTVNQVTTIAFSNVPSASFFARWLAKITNGGAFAVTWPASVVWPGGIAPTMSGAGVDWIEFYTLDGGTTVYGHVVQPSGVTGFNPVVIGMLSNVTTTSTSEVSLGTIVIPAGALNSAQRAVRVRAVAKFSVASSSDLLRIKFGSTYVGTINDNNGVSLISEIDVLVSFIDATHQAAYARDTIKGATLLEDTYELTAPAENLANAVTIDIRGIVAGGVTMTLLNASAEVI